MGDTAIHPEPVVEGSTLMFVQSGSATGHDDNLRPEEQN